MLRIEIPIGTEGWDEQKQEFVEPKVQVLTLEHSLVSLSKWESKWCKPFLSKQEKTLEETIDYIKCMTLTHNVDSEIYNYLTKENVKQINDYIEAPMTATTFSKDTSTKNNREIVTAELIYYWMIALNIPFECQKWHINRLLTLIRVCNVKNNPSKKSKRDTIKDYAALNAARKKKLNTKG
jgi:hypothetical protein